MKYRGLIDNIDSLVNKKYVDEEIIKATNTISDYIESNNYSELIFKLENDSTILKQDVARANSTNDRQRNTLTDHDTRLNVLSNSLHDVKNEIATQYSYFANYLTADEIASLINQSKITTEEIEQLIVGKNGDGLTAEGSTKTREMVYTIVNAILESRGLLSIDQIMSASVQSKVESLTKEEYNALATKDANTVYLIKDNAYANRPN